MGDVQEITTDTFYAWTGGKPHCSWTKLDSSASSKMISPNQLRVVGPKGITSYNLRSTGPGTKYKKGGDLESFVTTMEKHLVKHGMDSIAYRPDPRNPTEMINAVTNHARFNLSTVRPLSVELQKKFDSYDKQNDQCALDYFLDSLDTTLKTSIEKRQKKSDTFIDVWFIFLRNETPYSAERYELIAKRIKNRMPHQYPSQNILKMCEEHRADIRELNVMYDSQLSLSILTNLITGGGDNNNEYKQLLLQKKFELQAKLPEFFHLTLTQKEEELAKLGLGWEDILDLAEERYQLQMQEGNVTWPPACNAKDSKAPPAGFAAANNTAVQMLNALIQNGAASAGPICYGCGEAGHVKRDCPKSKGAKNNRGGAQGSHGNKNGKGGRPKSKNPRFQKPDSNARPSRHEKGHPVYEKEIDGKHMFWCGKCQRYTLSHHTGTHTGGKDKSISTDGPPPAAHLAQFQSFNLIPNAWVFDMNQGSWWSSMIQPLLSTL
jgi:hypothetical protein